MLFLRNRFLKTVPGVPLLWFALASRALAAEDLLKDVGKEAKLSLPSGAATAEQGVAILVGNIIKAALGLVGTVFLVLMLYAGFLWMTARGEKDHVTKAKDIIKNSIIGIIIVALAYVITNFVVGGIVSATQG